MNEPVDLLVQRCKATRRRLWELLEAPRERRPELARSPDFRDLDLADLLLEKAVAEQPDGLLQCEEMARLAFTIAEPIVEDRWVGRANDVKARACVLVGNVWRLTRSCDEAEEMFRKAVFHLTGPPDCRQRAFYCWNLALLREDQGQLDEAAGLLWRAALIYRNNGDLRDQGLCMAQLGFLFLEEEQAARAVPPLARACQMLEPLADVALYVRCSLALAYCHATLGQKEKSERCVAAARPLYSHLEDAGPSAHAAWFEGKLAALAGRPEEAAGFLDTARQVFLGAGDFHVAARVSIDLGLVWIGAGQAERVQELMDDLARALRRDHAKIGVLFALGPIVEASRRRLGPAEALASALSRLRCCRREPVLALGYWPPELNETVSRDGSDFDPSLGPTAPGLRVRRLNG